MSYLDLPRCHFAGNFTALPSGLNNNPDNYNINPNDITLNTPTNYPFGSHAWEITCTVQSFVDRQGQKHTTKNSHDPLLGATLKSGVNPAWAKQSTVTKIVDLDPYQQARTRLFGLYLTLTTSGDMLLEGLFDHYAALRDLWVSRAPSVSPYFGAGGVWQSILLDPIWHDTASPFLKTLAANSDGIVIQFAVYGYDTQSSSAGFRRGQIVGTIGPYYQHEPKYSLATRYLLPTPHSPMWNAPFKVNDNQTRITLDLSNAIPTKSARGDSCDLGPMQLALFGPKETILLGNIDYSQATYEQTGGIAQITLPSLTSKQKKQLQRYPIGIIINAEETEELVSATGQPVDNLRMVALKEREDGLIVTIDPAFVLLNPGDIFKANLYVTKFGQPQSDYTVRLSPVKGPSPGNKPKIGLSYPKKVKTKKHGHTTIHLQAGDPLPLPKARRDIGGQLYYLGGSWALPTFDTQLGAPLTVKVFNSCPVPDVPTWADVQPILYPYYILYGFMSAIVDLSDYTAVKAHKKAIVDTLTLPIEHPAFMPTSRDLSRDQLAILLRWFELDCPA